MASAEGGNTLLVRRGASIALAALAAGCYDQSALTNHLKRPYGITPLQWFAPALEQFWPIPARPANPLLADGIEESNRVRA
jgi:hypothetical protein